MSIGVYKLIFKGTDQVYIGKSLNIESRFSAHKYTLKKGIGSKKLQEAYNLYSMPTIQVLEKCDVNDLNSKEIKYISKFNSIKEGLNTAKGGSSTGSPNGYDTYNALYDKSIYLTILDMLTSTTMTTKEIAEYLSVKVNVVRDICSLTTHTWLKEYNPEAYAKLESTNRNSYLHSSNRAKNIVSPEGILYQVDNVEQFSKDNGLTPSGLHKVLHGTRLVHKGWHLESTTNTLYTEVVSPEGIMYSIAKGKAKEFAVSNGLTQSSFQRLLSGKVDSHKGWKLAIKLLTCESR